MPGTTANEFFPYPYMGETVNATSWANLANAIDAALVTLNAVATDAKKPPTVMVRETLAGTAITVATNTNIFFTTNQFIDPSSMHSTSSNTDQIITPEPGIYLCRGAVQVGGTTTLTGLKAAVSLNGTQVLARQENPKNLNTSWTTEVNGVVLSMAAGDIIRLVARWAGTGTATTIGCQLHVTRISKW
jgi:hypothetical protein